VAGSSLSMDGARTDGVGHVPGGERGQRAPAKKATVSPPTIAASTRSRVRRSGLRSGHSPRTALTAHAATTADRRLIWPSFHRPPSDGRCSRPRGDLPARPGPSPRAGRGCCGRACRSSCGGGQLAGCRARTQGGFSSRGQAGQVLTLTAGTVSPGSRQELFPVPRLRQVLSTWRPSGHRGRSCAPPGAAR
jgi:hypothetical protein